MAIRNFRTMLENKWSEGKFVCVGLDSDIEKLPKHILEKSTKAEWGFHDDDCLIVFNKAIINSTSDLVCAYKINTAFYEELGVAGIHALQRAVDDINFMAPDVPVILDAKRGDIGNTNKGYVEFAFNHLGADAITVHPYMGQESLQPFLDCVDKGIFILCRTSNPGAGEFQDLSVREYHELSHIHPEDSRMKPLYMQVAHRVSTFWNKNQNCGLVVGATNPDELRRVRVASGSLPILIPGIGAQGGDLEKTVLAGINNDHEGIIVNSSRAIIFASGERDFAEAARNETSKLSTSITNILKGEK